MSMAAAAQVTEAELVREVLYVLQGIDGTFIKSDPRQARYVISDKVSPQA
jgi:hypothetical protein